MINVECSLKLGIDVEVNENCEYYADWRGEVRTVVCLELLPDGSVNVTIADAENAGWANNWDDSTDGFSPEELTPV